MGFALRRAGHPKESFPISAMPNIARKDFGDTLPKKSRTTRPALSNTTSTPILAETLVTIVPICALAYGPRRKFLPNYGRQAYTMHEGQRSSSSAAIVIYANGVRRGLV